MTKHSLNTKLKRFLKSDKPFKSYDQISISIYMLMLRNNMQYM